MIEALKPSGVEGFGEIPADWEVTKMAFTFSFGKGLSITKEDLQDEGVPSITYGDIHSRFGFQINPEVDEVRCVDHRYLKSGRTALLQFGDFIFADTSEDIAGSGNFTHLNSRASAFAGYHTITARAKRELDVRFVAYLFDSEPFRNQIRNSVSGVKVFSITQTILKNAKLLLPPVPEQQAIAALLDDCCGQVDSMIIDLEQQVELLQQYKKALITETVTKGLDKNVPMKDSGINWIGEMPKHWDVKRLKFLGSARNGLTYAPEDIVDEGEGILVLRSSNIQNDALSFDDKVYVRSKIPNEIILQENDLLICSRNGSQALIGKCALIDKETVGQTYGAFMCVYRSRYNKFIHYVFLSDIFSFYLGTFLTSTVNQLTNMNLYNIRIPIPLDEGEQKEIVNYLDSKCTEIDTLVAEKRRSIETMRQYRRSLIYEYVTGKKRVAH
jgi:type I restriction enzyme S subunit